MRLMTALGAALVARPAAAEEKLAGGDAPHLRRDGAHARRRAPGDRRVSADARWNTVAGTLSDHSRADAVRQDGRQPFRADFPRSCREEPRRSRRAISCRAATSSFIRIAAGAIDPRDEFVKYLSDGLDGYDTCAWIVHQSWCNGKIGTMGLSYAAHTQGALACAGAPGIAAMFIDSGGFANAYQDGIRQGGRVRAEAGDVGVSRGARESRGRSLSPTVSRQGAEIDIRDWFARMPWKRGHTPLSLAPEYEAYVYEQWQHGTFDSFWKQLGIYAEGFYDRFAMRPWCSCRPGSIPIPVRQPTTISACRAARKGR